MMPEIRLGILIAKWLDGRLDDEESQALQQELHESAAARSKFREYAHLDVVLHEFADAGDLLGQQNHATKKQRITSKVIQKSAWLALAASMLIMLGLSIWWNVLQTAETDHQALAEAMLVRPPLPVGRVVEDANAVWSAAHGVGVEKMVKYGQILELEQGRAQVSMACGADVILRAPCMVKLVSDDLIELMNGQITAQAATWATGFVVEAKGLRVTDLGTKFAVSVDASGVAEAHVFKGSVLADPMRDVRPKQPSVKLNQGEAIRVSLPESTIDLIAARKPEFFDQFSKLQPLKPIRIWNTGIGGAVGQKDVHWTITSGAPENGPYPRPAVITTALPEYLDNKPESSQWISINTNPVATPDSVHTFETRFNLSGYDLDTICMVGLFLVDDSINRLRINGISIPFDRKAPTWINPDFQRFRAIVIDKGFVTGENVISIDLYNYYNQHTRLQHGDRIALVLDRRVPKFAAAI